MISTSVTRSGGLQELVEEPPHPRKRVASSGRSALASEVLLPDGFQRDIVAALRDILHRAEVGTLEPTAMPGAELAIVVEYENVRCLIVDTRYANHGLSPREMEIARLVAGGATNRAIGTTLDISLWTVSTHLRRIFAKLHVSSRAEMVAKLLGATQLSADI
jgi:DNA-binding CsgD family transcriptional regulator